MPDNPLIHLAALELATGSDDVALARLLERKPVSSFAGACLSADR